MTDPKKSLVGRARKKRTQERTRKSARPRGALNLPVLLVTLLLWKGVMALLHLGSNPVITDLTPGQIAPITLQAEIDFETENLDATEIRRERVMNEMPPVLAVQQSRLRESEGNLERFLRQVSEVQGQFADPPASGGLSADEFASVLELLNLPPSLVVFPHEIPPELREQLDPLLLRELRAVWMEGIIAAEDKSTGFQGFVTGSSVKIGAEALESVPLDSIPTLEQAARTATARVAAALPLPDSLPPLLENLFQALLETNLIVDGHGSRSARLAAGLAVEPVLELRPQGTTLVEARSRITAQNILDVQKHAEALRLRDSSNPDRARIVSQGIILFAGLAMSLMLMLLLQRDLTLKIGRLILWSVLTLLALLLAKALVYLAGNMNLIPGHMLRPLLSLGLAPLLATILHGPRFALAVGLSSSLAIALLQDSDMMLFFCGMALTLTAAFGVRSIHKRSNLFRAGLWIGGVKALVTIGMGLSEQVTAVILAQQAFGAFSSGLLSSILVLLLIPPFEYLFKLTTDVRLLELSDMSHPLLGRLAMEAPGTYHHSLMVAHLSQTAAKEIGANDLLVRVCAYYHDIGKLTKPEFFIENIHGRQNPHDELSPSMSRLIVISHVKEGVSLAHRYKLPPLIIEGIEQHHGTGVIQYFYHRARTRADGKVEIEDYRYPGPRPKSREMGILLMADAIEAASRSIDKNKPGQIEGLVNEIIREKLNDGQLDLCGLTMADVTSVRRSFIFSLNNMLHGRIAYPKDAPADKTAAAPHLDPASTSEDLEP